MTPFLKRFSLYSLLAGFFCIVLQIQMSILVSETYKGLRVNVADLFIPFAGFLVIVLLIKKRSYWPKFYVRGMYFWLLALLGVMTIGLVNGYFANGFLSQWAFINKYIGFYLLLSYLGLGAWLSCNAPNYKRLVNSVAISFTGFYVFVMILAIISYWVQPLFSFDLLLWHFPWEGLMGNRNALMLVFVAAFLFVIYNSVQKEIQMPSFLVYGFWFVLPFLMVFNVSRAGWIACGLLGVLYFAKCFIKKIKVVGPILLLGSVATYGMFLHVDNPYIKNGRAFNQFMELAEGADAKSQTNAFRYIAVEDGLEMYQQSNPIIGAGLGHYKEFQTEKRGEFIEIMDFTGLWLLSEMGALGLGVFAAFFLICLYRLYVLGYRQGDDYLAIHRAMFVFLILFALISLLHEQLYARFMWFIMGIALAQPIVSAAVKESQ